MRNPMVGVVGLAHGCCVNSVTCFAINSTYDTIATGSDEGLLILWHINMLHTNDLNGLRKPEIDIFPTSISVTSKYPMTTPILDLCFVASSLPNVHLGVNDNLATLHSDNSICIWSMIDLRCIARVNFTFKFDRLAVLADRRFIAAFGNEIHILDTWNLGIIANFQTPQPILDLACTQYPPLHNIKPSYQQKQLICAITNDELNCWDVTNSCSSKQSRFSKTEYILNNDLSNSQANSTYNAMNHMKTPLTPIYINNKIGKIRLKNQICMTKNLIFAIAGPRITVCILSNTDNELYPLMDFLNPDIDIDSNYTESSNWRYIQLIDLSNLTNKSDDDESYSNFKATYKRALVACNNQQRVYCYILPENTCTDDEIPQYHSLVKATYIGKFSDNIYSIATPIFILGGYTTDYKVRENGYENCCLDFIVILINSKGIYIQQFINSFKGSYALDKGYELIYSMENILPRPLVPSIKVSAMSTFKINNVVYIAYSLTNGYICCVCRGERIKLHSPQTLIEFIIKNDKIPNIKRIIYNFQPNISLNGFNTKNSITHIRYMLSLNDYLILTDGYSICIYKFSDTIYPSYLISGWHSHKIRSIHHVIVPMGSLIRQSLDHFITLDISGRIIIWYIISFNTYLTHYGELPSSHYILERVMIKNIHKFILDEPRSLAIAITLKRVLIWSLETQTLISNESKIRYIIPSKIKNINDSNSNTSDTLGSFVPQIKKFMYGNNTKGKDNSNYYGTGKNGLKFSVPRYHNVLYSKDLFKDEYLSTGGSAVCSNLFLKGLDNKSISMSIIASAINGKTSWISLLDTFPVNFLPCTLGGFWITMHLTLSLIDRHRQYEDRNIIGFPDVKFSIYNIRCSHLTNLFDLSQISYKLYTIQGLSKIYKPIRMGLYIDRIWLLGHYILIGSLPGQSIDLMIMGKRAEQLLRELFSNFNDTLTVYTLGLLMGILLTSRVYIQRLKVLSNPPSFYIIDKSTYKYLLTHKIRDGLLTCDLNDMEPIEITEHDIDNLKRISKIENKSTKTVSTGALHVGLTPQFPITDLACILLSILAYEKPTIVSNTFAYIDNSNSDNLQAKCLGDDIFIIAIRLLGCKIFSYTETFSTIPITIPPFNGTWKSEHTELFTRLLTCLFPLLKFTIRGNLASNILNNLMFGYPYATTFKNDFKRIITSSAFHCPDVLSNSIHFAQLGNNFVSEIVHHLLSNDLILPETLHLFSFYMVTALNFRREIKKFLFKFPMISIHNDVIAFGYSNGNIHLYNIYNGQLVKEYFAHESPIACLALDSQGENIAAYQHHEPALHVWKILHYNFLKTFTTSANVYRKLELKKFQENYTMGLPNVKIQFKSKNEWFLHREDGRAYIVRG